MKQTLFKKLTGKQKDHALLKIMRANNLYNYIPIYSLEALKNAITDPEQNYDPDADFRFFVEGNTIRLEAKYLCFF